MWVEFHNQNVDTKYYYRDILVRSKVIKVHICAHLLRQHRSPRWCERNGKLQTQTRIRSDSCALDSYMKMWHMSTIFYICLLWKYLCDCCTSFCFTSCILFRCVLFSNLPVGFIHWYTFQIELILSTALHTKGVHLVRTLLWKRLPRFVILGSPK